MTKDEENQLVQYLVKEFNSTTLNAFLTTHVWPALKAARVQSIKQGSIDTYAMRYEAQRNARRELALERDRSTRFMSMDNAPMTNREVGQCAKNHKPLREIGTGRIMVFNESTIKGHKGWGRWEEYNPK